MLQEQTKNWNYAYSHETRMSYPAEYVIRMFRGKYPNLDLGREGYKGKSILDIGCGDGRHLLFFNSLGFSKVAGTEISAEVLDVVRKNISEVGVNADLRVGTNNNLGFEDAAFDFLLSWNVCYYLDDDMDFLSHIKEYARVLNPNGILVFSIPCKDCYVYKGGVEKAGFMTIKDDYFELRNGSVQKIFQDEKDIEQTFSSHFKDFVFGKIDDKCFGLDYKWYIGYCRKK